MFLEIIWHWEDSRVKNVDSIVMLRDEERKEEMIKMLLLMMVLMEMIINRSE